MAKEKRTSAKPVRWKPSELEKIHKKMEELGDSEINFSSFVRKTVLRACRTTRDKLRAWWDEPA